MSSYVENLYHYPIKGLTAQSLQKVALTKGQGFPLDRAFGFARPESGFDPNDPKPLPKTKFVMLAREEGLALLDTHFDEVTETLSISRGRNKASFDLASSSGREAASSFLADLLGFPPDLQPTLYSAEPHKFTDVSVVSPEMMNSVSLINLNSVTHFSQVIGQSVDPARFRGNIHFSGFPPFSELDLVGQHIALGEIEMKVVLRTKRCPATQVNLQSGKRDLDIPKLLQKHLGHSNMGIYAEVLSSGNLKLGDQVRLTQLGYG